MKPNNKWFTFVELIVTSVILVILTTTGFYSYIWYLSEARDSERKSDLAKVGSSLSLYKQRRWAYPHPANYFNLTNSGHIVAYQWLLDKGVSLSTLDVLPLDPHVKQAYFYSTTANRKEYELALSYENGDFPVAGKAWDYKSVSKNVLPSIILAGTATGGTNVEIHDGIGEGTNNRNRMIFNKWENLPYEFFEPYNPFYAGTSLGIVIDADSTDFWQNSDYRSCSEIEEAGKVISGSWITEEYQIINEHGALTNTGCTFSG